MRTLLPLRMGRTAGTVLLPALSRRCPRWRMATSRSTSNVLTSRYIRQRQQFNDVCIIILSDTATGDAMHFLAVMVFICWPKAHNGVFVCTLFFFGAAMPAGTAGVSSLRRPTAQLPTAVCLSRFIDAFSYACYEVRGKSATPLLRRPFGSQPRVLHEK